MESGEGYTYEHRAVRVCDWIPAALNGVRYPQGTHEWAKFLKPEELREIAERHGLRLVGQQGVMYVPFLRTFISEPWCRLMYMMAFEKM